jgi:phosphatidylglycerol:prolipoprotein diacylglycerol transferase
MLHDLAIGPLTLYQAWGVLTGLVYAAILLVVGRRAGIGTRDVLVIGVVTCAALYLGSRLFFEILEFPFMAGRMWLRVPPLARRLLMPNGFTYLGGIGLMGLAHLALGSSRLVEPGPGRILDLLSPVTAVVFALSKVGCVLAGCCYGRPTGAPWGFEIAHMHLAGIERTVPVRFIEMGISLAIGAVALVLLLRAPTRWRLRDGTIYAFFLAASSVARFLAGFLRGGYEVRLGPLDAVQWGSLGLAVAGTALGAALLATRGPSREDA